MHAGSDWRCTTCGWWHASWHTKCDWCERVRRGGRAAGPQRTGSSGWRDKAHGEPKSSQPPVSLLGASPFVADVASNTFTNNGTTPFRPFSDEEARALAEMESPPPALAPLVERARGLLASHSSSAEGAQADGPAEDAIPITPTTTTLLHAERKVWKVQKRHEALQAQIRKKEAEMDELRQQQSAVEGRLAVASAKVLDIKRALGFLGDRAPLAPTLPAVLAPAAVDHIATAFNQLCANELSEGAFRMLLAEARRASVAGVPAERLSEDGEDSDNEYPPIYPPGPATETGISRRRALSGEDGELERNTRGRAASHGARGSASTRTRADRSRSGG